MFRRYTEICRRRGEAACLAFAYWSEPFYDAVKRDVQSKLYSTVVNGVGGRDA